MQFDFSEVESVTWAQHIIYQQEKMNVMYFIESLEGEEEMACVGAFMQCVLGTWLSPKGEEENFFHFLGFYNHLIPRKE